MQKTCPQCRTAFEITESDFAFYEELSPVFHGRKYLIPPPTLCPMCRLQRRLSFRNQNFVYQRPSSLSGKAIFSRFTPDVPFPVVENDWWYGDQWDARSYGQEFDEHIPFFSQFLRLQRHVPHRTISIFQCENCDYCNNDIRSKNCYLVFNTTGAEDCLYCENCTKSKDCIDCTYCPASELCYDCALCERCYNLQSSECCEDCSSSCFLSHCNSCKDCFGCINLSHRQYCIFNEQKSEAEYREFLAKFPSSSFGARKRMREECLSRWISHPRPHAIVLNAESVTGDHILNSKNVSESFFVQDCEDVRYCFSLYEHVHSAQDFSFFGQDSELLYEAAQCGIHDVRVVFSFDSWDGNSDLFYCWMCTGCKYCFGCVGLQKMEYCIFNRQYTKEEYEERVLHIIGHMQKNGEWGEFFPMTFSPIPYNHSVAQRYFPLSKKEAADRGLVWYERETEDATQAVPASSLPDELPAQDEALIVKSERNGKTFRITSQEIKRYRTLRVPLPRITYDERMEDRITLLGGIRLYERQCAKTGKPILTTFAPNTPFPVWERSAYNKEFRG